MTNPKIIACDFDNTLCYTQDTYPNLGEPNWPLIRQLKKEREAGAVFILYTCRELDHLEIAVNACISWGISPDYVNDNVPWVKEQFGINSRKVFAHEYWDDRAWHVDFNPRKVVSASD